MTVQGSGVVVHVGGLEGDAGQVHPVVQGVGDDVGGDGETVVASGLFVAVVEGVYPFLGADGIGVYLVAVSGPVEGEEVGSPVRITN